MQQIEIPDITKGVGLIGTQTKRLPPSHGKTQHLVRRAGPTQQIFDPDLKS